MRGAQRDQRFHARGEAVDPAWGNGRGPTAAVLWAQAQALKQQDQLRALTASQLRTPLC